MVSSAYYVFCFVFLRLVYPMLSVSLDCSFLKTLSVFPYVYFLCIHSYIFFTLCNREWGRGIGSYFDLLTHSYIFFIPYMLLISLYGKGVYPVNELSFVSAYFIWKQVASMTYVHILTCCYPYDCSHEFKEFSPLHSFRITMVTFVPSCLLRLIILPTMFDCVDSCIVCNKQLV